jgi:RNA polymerase sigma-70 factor (ECF subfamily)
MAERRTATVVPDADVVARCRGGDDRAWQELVGRFAPYVYAIAVRAYRLSEEDAEDVFQEVFLRTWQHIGELRSDAAIRPWIGQLTRRLAIDRLRAGSRERARLQDDDLLAERRHDPFGGIEDVIVVGEAIARLPAGQREIVERFFVRDESHAAIAEALGIAEGTVASRISRARRHLRVQLAA